MTRVINLSVSNTVLSGDWLDGDFVIVLCDATNGAFTVTMPDATASRNVDFFIRKTDSSANAVAVIPKANSGQLLKDLSGNETSITLTGLNATIDVKCDFNNWQVISSDAPITGWTGGTNYTADRAFDVTTATNYEIANVLATLIVDLKTSGVLSA